MTARYKTLRGTRDILPDEIDRWRFLERTAASVFARYGYREVRTPILETTELFARSVGQTTDIVRKEMYTLELGGESITLRPENTAALVRAVVEHSLYRNIAAGYPERYYYIGPMFRHERPQRGRQRQFHQIGVEILGDAEPFVDAELLQMIDVFLDDLGIHERELLLGSVGDATCRPTYRDALVEWLRPRLGELCDDCRRRFADNPLRVLDCKVEQDRRLLANAPAMLELLCGSCQEHLAAVRRLLDRFGIRYRMEPRLVRGLDYYERTVFEVVSRNLGAQNAILGGGRYDRLVEDLGGPAIPGIGFAMGMERTILLLDPQRSRPSRSDVALVGLGKQGWDACIDLARRLRLAGLSVVAPTTERSMGAQLKRADRLGVRYAVFVGPDEISSGLYGLKDLRSGEQESLDERAIAARLGAKDD